MRGVKYKVLECGVYTKAWSVAGVWSGKCRVWSVERKVRSVGSRVRSVESRVWSEKCQG